MMKRTLTFALSTPLVLTLIAGCASSTAERTTMTESATNTNGPLAMELAARKEAFGARATQEKKDLYEGGIVELRDSGIVGRAIRTGDAAPRFILPSATGEKVELSALTDKGPVVVVWYRGGWCPYCNITLKAYQDRLDEIDGLGATLVAISPELPDKSLDTQQKNELRFQVLSDVGNRVAREYGVLFSLNDQLHKAYQDGFDLHSYNGDDTGGLPLAATYVIGTDGEVKWHFLSADYRERAEPQDVIDALRSLKR